MKLISWGYRKVKVVKCYLSLLVWLILVSIGLYWFLNRNGNEIARQSQTGFGYQDGQVYQDSGESSSGGGEVKSKDNANAATTHSAIQENESNQIDEKDNTRNVEKNVKHNDADPDNVVSRLCNQLHTIQANEENFQDPDFKLEAVVILFRHGDRGPLTHIGHRNVSHINCSPTKSEEFDQLTKFATDTLIKLSGYSAFIGPFHNFPRVSSSPFCSLGQLSQLGSAQLLTLGKLIRSIYRPKVANLTSFNNQDISQSFKVEAYSTRYRRTFQSLFAFLYGLLGPKHLIQSTTLHESQSITFCFKHCSCKAVDRLKKVANRKFQPKKSDKAIMTQLVTQLNFVLGTDKSKKTGSSLLDSLLVYHCHNRELPCHQDNHKATKVQLLFKTIKNLSLYNHHTSQPSSPSCITINHMINLVELINKENEGLKQVPESRKYHLLNSYGLLKEIVNLALRMTTTSPSSSPSMDGWRKQLTPIFAPDSAYTSFTSNNNIVNRGASEGGRQRKIVVFSGHDTTLQSLTTALGLEGHQDLHLPPFGSRLIFEFYKRINASPNSARNLYFRVVYNGLAVRVSFCKRTEDYGTSNSDTYKTAKHSNSKLDNKALFCPIENLVRFIYDNYFNSFDNATNFKDACKRS